MNCYFKKYTLLFRKPGGTSRGVLLSKDTYFIICEEDGKKAYGECNLFTGLSYDDREGYEEKLKEVCKRLPVEKEKVLSELHEWPSIRFGVEMVLKDLENGCRQIIYSQVINKHGFAIPINGLIWMGEKQEMMAQIASKLEAGYQSIKLKIGAIDFETELELIRFIRTQFNADSVEIRLDANGAFEFSEAIEKLKRLSDFDISYLEQPIKAGQWHQMAALIEKSPVRIALDEELIGVTNSEQRHALIHTISPPLLILKPALIGGFASTVEWKQLIEEKGGSWIITSALESNIGLNAIAQYTALGWSSFAQGLGTGQLYTNNFPSPYTVDAQGLHYHTERSWDFSLLS